MAATTVNPNTVVGRAVYMEFRNGKGETQQCIVVPDGFASDGSYVPSSRVCRRVSADKPKTPWGIRASTWQNAYNADRAEILPVTKDDLAASLNERRQHYLPFLDQLSTAGYTLFQDAIIAVEVTSADLEDIRTHRTPWKILNRITRSRRGLGLPEEIYDTTA